MIISSSWRKSFLGVLAAGLLVCSGLFFSYEPGNPFDGTGTSLLLLLFLAGTFMSVNGYAGFGADIDTSFIKLLLSNPVTRLQYFINSLKAVFCINIALLFLLASLLITLQSLAMRIVPQNILLCAAGLVQYGTVLTALSVITSISIRSRYSLIIPLVLPLFSLFENTRRVFHSNNDDIAGIAFIQELILPVITSFRNTVVGYSPEIPRANDTVVFSASAGLFLNLYPFLWALCVLFLSAYIICRRDY